MTPAQIIKVNAAGRHLRFSERSSSAHPIAYLSSSMVDSSRLFGFLPSPAVLLPSLVNARICSGRYHLRSEFLKGAAYNRAFGSS